MPLRAVVNHLLALFAACAMLAACSSGTETAGHKAAEAAFLLENGDLQGAYDAASASVEARDDIAENWMLLGRINLMRGVPAEAYDAYSRAVELDVTNMEALLSLSELALQAGRGNEALKWADQLLSLRPDLTRPKLVKGFIALRRNQLDVANQLAEEILAADPQEDAGIVLKARLLARKGQLETADKMLAERLDPSELVLVTLSEVRRAAGDGERLADTLGILVTRWPTTDRVFDLAAVNYKLGNPGAARKLLIDRLIERPTDAGLYERAKNYFLEIDPKAFDDKAVIAAAANGPPQLRELAGGALLELGEAERAKALLEKNIGAGTSSDSWALFATALYRLGSREDAMKIVAKVLESDESNTTALLVRARSNLDQGKLAASLEDAQLALRDAPMSLPSKLAVIEVYRRRGNLAQARRLFEQAAIDMPQSIRLAKAFMAYLRATGDTQRAENIALTYASVNPTRLNGWDLLSQSCSDAGCGERIASGKQAALKAFVPDDQVSAGGNGLFGRL